MPTRLENPSPPVAQLQPQAQPQTQHASTATLVASLVQACPDLRQMARDVAQSILRKHGVTLLEPDDIYWHRFSTAQSSSRAFTGWQHQDKPVQSLTLPQLVMQRFNPQDQEATDQLQQMSGFYSADEHAEYYDERNEVRLLPAQVISDFWAIDFRCDYIDKLTRFWEERAADFRALAKASFIGKALDDQANGDLSAEDIHTLMQAIGVDLSMALTFEVFKTGAATTGNVQVCTFDVVGYEACDILRFVEPSGRQILYLPGELQSFHAFDKPADLQWWLMSHTHQAENRLRFMSHFAQATHAEEGSQIGLYHALDLLFSTWGSPTTAPINRNGRALTIDPFDHLSDAAKKRMFADADSCLRSNADLRKQLWIGYLGAFAHVFSPLAALDWPIALAVVGAGLAETGLNIDQAIHGHTTAERKAGVIGAILSAVDTALNSTLLIHPGAELPDIEPATEVQAPEPALGVEPTQPAATAPKQANELLAPFETNAVLDAAEPLPAEGKMQGVYLQDDGSTYICIDGLPYAVRYVNELQTWVIIDPRNPFSFYRNLPVAKTASGVWAPTTTLGLRGGGQALSRLSLRPSATAPAPTAVTGSPYDVPEDLRAELREAAEDDACKYYDGFRYLPDGTPDPFDAFEVIRDQLRQDAGSFFTAYTTPTRPALPSVSLTASPRQFLENTFEHTHGLVIGEAHSSIGSKRFLIDNMPQLARLKVKTLYMEHLLTDFHQADLDTFAQSGRMPKRLESYVKSLDVGHFTDPSGRYTFMNLIKTARLNRIRVQAIDCMASYRLRDLTTPSEPLRQKMMNYFASKVIKAHQASIGGRRWVALVGNTHANTFEGVPGLAELEGATGLRVEDVMRGTPAGFDLDPGFTTPLKPGNRTLTVKSDIRLRAATRKPVAQSLPIEQRLKNVGDFMINRTGPAPELIHHSREGQWVRTPIQLDDDGLYVLRANWPRISGRHFNSYSELSLMLKLLGMKEVA